MEALLGAGADPGVRETIGCTALHRACETPYPTTAAALLAAGCPPDTPDLEGATPLHYTFQSPEDASGKEADREATVASLLAAKADVRAMDQNGATALHYAAIVACTGAVVKLLQGGADVRVVSVSLSLSLLLCCDHANVVSRCETAPRTRGSRSSANGVLPHTAHGTHACRWGWRRRGRG